MATNIQEAENTAVSRAGVPPTVKGLSHPATGSPCVTGPTVRPSARPPVPAVGLFLLLGVVAGLTEPGERAVVARLAPVRMGRGFGSYHALLGTAALPAGLIFGALYQSVRGRAALWASAAGMALAVTVWLIVSPVREESRIP